MNEKPSTLKKIFVIEDDVFIGSILTEKIKESHMDVHLFTTAEDALIALESEIPDVILLDIYLPGMDGLTALDQIRKNEKTKDIPVIVLSNNAEKKDRDEAARLGARFLVKASIDPGEVLHILLDMFKK